MSKPAFADRILTIDEFFAIAPTLNGRAELIDGRIVMMAGGTRQHDRVSADIYAALRVRLRGTACQPSSANLGIETSVGNVRYPDAAISCDPRDLDQSDADVLVHRHPRVIFEVLSRSTAAEDRLVKLQEYQAIESVDTIVIIDSIRARFDTYERVGPNEWRNLTHLPGTALALRDPAITIPAEEIFGAD